MRQRSLWWLLLLLGGAALVGLHHVHWTIGSLLHLEDRHLLASDFLQHPSSVSPATASPPAPAADFVVPAPQRAGQCIVYEHVDSWGYAPWGSAEKASSAAECCERCLQSRGSSDPEKADCNIWVWCADPVRCGSQYQDCWIKWLPYVRVIMPKEASLNDTVPWMSGTSADLDLTEDMYSWKLKAHRSWRDFKADNTAHDPQQSPSATASSEQGLRGGEAQAHRGDGSVTASSVQRRHSLDPLQLVDTSLAKLKEGVGEPQMYHTVMSVQGRRRQGGIALPHGCPFLPVRLVIH